ncbi:MAG: hypothetical protein ACXWPM_01005 [Bdellovibrionota bacterium]
MKKSILGMRAFASVSVVLLVAQPGFAHQREHRGSRGGQSGQAAQILSEALACVKSHDQQVQSSQAFASENNLFQAANVQALQDIADNAKVQDAAAAFAAANDVTVSPAKEQYAAFLQQLGDFHSKIVQEFAAGKVILAADQAALSQCSTDAFNFISAKNAFDANGPAYLAKHSASAVAKDTNVVSCLALPAPAPSDGQTDCPGIVTAANGFPNLSPGTLGGPGGPGPHIGGSPVASGGGATIASAPLSSGSVYTIGGKPSAGALTLSGLSSPVRSIAGH